ncbi:MAG: CBS domain-containing protein, partial [Planctomycetota bacterium]
MTKSPLHIHPMTSLQRPRRRRPKRLQTRSLEAAEDKAVSEEPAEAPESAVDQSEPAPPDASAGQSDAVPETSTAWDAAEEESQEAEPAKEPALGPISEAIKEMARLSVSLAESGTAGPAKEATPDGASQLLGMCAKDIMQNRVVWVDPDDSVQEALTKLQLHDIGYLAVGYDEILEGIVSKADVAGAMSPYLRPMFGKWRRPSDDATLRI